MHPVEVQLVAARLVSDVAFQRIGLTYRSASIISDMSRSGGVMGALGDDSLSEL